LDGLGINEKILVQPILLAQLTDPDNPPPTDVLPELVQDTSKPSTVAPPIILQPIAITQLLSGQVPTPIAPVSNAVTGTLDPRPAHAHWSDVIRHPPTNVTHWTSGKGLPYHSLQNPAYIGAMQTLEQTSGPRIWEITRRAFILAGDRDGLSFWNGSRLTLSMKNLYRTLAKQNFCLVNYPADAPLPHHAGSSVGAAKGFSGLPETWLRKISTQLADPNAGLCFQKIEEQDGKFTLTSQATRLTDDW
jgi:hypothetical protein